MLETTNLELFLDFYISKYSKTLTPLYIANRFCKEVLNIPSKDLMRRGISEKNKRLRKELADKFLEIIKKRNYPKDFKYWIAD